MHQGKSMIGEQSRGIGVRAVTMAIEPRSYSVTAIIRSMYRSACRWMAGRRDDIQIIAVQRGDFSIIT